MAQLIKINPNNFHKIISHAVSILKEGGVVAFPTDTVYGIGANAFNRDAVEKIYIAKRRPKDKPLPVLVASKADVMKISACLHPCFEKLTAKFWPGALTLVVKANDSLPVEVTAGRKSVGVRMPDNRIALSLIEKFGSPLATTSANFSGEREALSAEEVQNSIGDEIDLILDGGPTTIGIVSTVLDISTTPFVIHRKGKITVEQLSELLGEVFC